METMHASYPPHPPLRQPSHLSESRPRPTFDQPTRNMQLSDSQSQQLSAPASQESIVSSNSYGSSVASQLQSASSNASQLTSYTDTDSTSPSSTAATNKTEHSTSAISNDAEVRDRTPEDQAGNDRVDTLISPASSSTPVATIGTKRTSDGHAKDVPGGSLTPSNGGFVGNRSRAASAASSSSSSRAGELAASLKARLGYAMTKVQNGWEHKSFSEVERLTAQKAANRHSMSHLDYSRRPASSGLSNGTSRLSMYEPHYTNKVPNLEGAFSPPSKRSSGTYTTFAPTKAPYTTATTPRLQPAPDIRPMSGYRSHPYAQPSLQRARHNGAMSPPRTPVTQQPHRPQPIRTDTQTAEAEREAMVALFQLGSPHGYQIPRGQTASRASSSQTSPLRTEFATPRQAPLTRSNSADSVHQSRQDALREEALEDRS